MFCAFSLNFLFAIRLESFQPNKTPDLLRSKERQYKIIMGFMKGMTDIKCHSKVLSHHRPPEERQCTEAHALKISGSVLQG